MIRRSARTRCASLCRRFARWQRVAVVLPNRCALCGNLSHAVICGACDAAYWNEARLRCDVCARCRWASGHRVRPRYVALAPAALPHTVATRAARRLPFDATLALADYRAPLDAARGLKFHRQLALGTEFAARLARLIDDTPGAGGRPGGARAAVAPAARCARLQ